MRKKELMLRLGQLVKTAETLSLQLEELKAENERLKKELSEVNNGKSEETETVTEDAEEIITEPEGFTVSVIDEVEIKEEDAEPKLSNEALEYAAGVIGKLTVESAKYSDTLSVAGGTDIKDLLSLILGKSEMCKSEILSIALSDASLEAKQQMIDSQMLEAVDYFKSVSEQK